MAAAGWKLSNVRVCRNRARGMEDRRMAMSSAERVAASVCV
jgi:hypothetical protein